MYVSYVWGEQKLYENEEIMHRVLEANPLMAAVPGFKEAANRQLTGEEVRRMNG